MIAETDTKRLRSLMERYGARGVLLVAVYMAARHAWTRHCQLCLVSGVLALAVPVALVLCLHEHHQLAHKPLLAPPPAREAPAARPSPLTDSELHTILHRVERQIKDNPDVPPIGRCYQFSRMHDLKDAQGSLTFVLAHRPESARACTDMAQCEMQLGRYPAASQALTQALLLAPRYNPAVKLQGQVRSLAEVCHAVTGQLPADRRIMQIRRVQVRQGECLWAVLHCKLDPDNDSESLQDTRLALCSDLPECRLLATSDRLTDSRFDDDGYDAFTDVEVYPLDITGAGTPQLVVHEIMLGGSWDPSQMEVFAWDGHHLNNIARVQSDEPLYLEDLEHNDTYQILNCSAIEGSMCHAEQPRWSDVYAYENGRFVIADRRYPSEFREWPAKLRAVLRQYPADPEIIAYLCLADAVLGHRRQALALRAQAMATFRQESKDRDYSEEYHQVARAHLGEMGKALK